MLKIDVSTLLMPTSGVNIDLGAVDPFDGQLQAAGGILWLLRDEFTTDLAAGAVNGTAAEPGPGTRTVVDTENKLTIANGKLTFAGGKAVPASGDPGLWYGAVTRVAGKLQITQFNITTKGIVTWGFDSNQTGAVVKGVCLTAAGDIYTTSAASFIVASHATSTDYLTANLLRTNGRFLLIKGGVFTNWTLLYIDADDTTATLYPGISNNNAVGTFSFLRIPTLLWLPSPLLSTSGAMTWPLCNGYGHAEGEQANTAEKVVNGGFASDLTGWTLQPRTGGTIAWDAGTIKFTQGGSSEFLYATQSIPTIPGVSYTYSVSCTAQNGGNFHKIRVGTTSNGTELGESAYGGTQTYSLTFTATTYLTWITINDDSGTTKTSNWDNATCKVTTPATVLGSGGSGLTLLDGGTWSVAGGYMLNTPGAGVEMIVDPGFDDATKWTAGTGWAVAGSQAAHTGGVNAAIVDNSGTQSIVGQWYECIVNLVAAAGNTWIGPNTTDTMLLVNSPTGQRLATMRATVAARPAVAATADNTVSSFSCKPLPISNLITNTQLSTTDILAEEVIHARTAGTQVGMALNLDRSFAAKCAATAAAGQRVISLKEVTGVGGVGISTNETITIAGTTYTVASVAGGSNVAYDDTAKTQTVTLGADLGAQVAVNDKVGVDWAAWNGVMAYFDGAGNCKLDEIKGGVYTNRISAAVTFVADKRLITRKIGTSYYVFYNETLVGSTTAVDAAAMAGMYHGMFSTLAANTINSLLIYYVGSSGEYNANLNTFST